MENGKYEKVSGLTFFLLASCAFAGMMTDAFFTSGTLFGASSHDDLTSMQSIISQLITCVAWSVVAVVLIKAANGKYKLDLFGKKEKLKIWQWITVVGISVFVIAFFYLVSGNNFRVIMEFQYLFQEYGLPKIFVQLIYYFLEIVIVSLIIIFAHKSGEIWFKKKHIPYGGIFLGLTWGLAHIFTKDMAVGIVAFFLGILLGTVYLLVNRDLKKTIIISLFMLFV
jgi:hypothetical protein